MGGAVWEPYRVLILASSQYDILFCSETLVSDVRHMSELLVHGFVRSVVPVQDVLARVMVLRPRIVIVM